MSHPIRLPLGSRTADLVALLLVLVCNPVLYYFNDGILHYGSPDAVAYVTLGRSLVTTAQLYVASWGHVDFGLILPPLYPLLIGLGGLLSDDLLRLAVWVSGVSLILAGPVFFLLIRGPTGRLVATCTALAIPLGVIFRYAFAPLTEAFFLLLMALTLLFLGACLSRGRTLLALATGLLCALTFLTRPVGLFLLVFCLLWVAFAEPIGWGRRRATALRHAAAILAGFLLLAVPYAVALYVQTAQHPLQRTFRLGQYSIGSSDPRVLEEIRQIQAESEGDYRSLIRRRRMMRKLLPDASEMYYALVKTGDGSVAGRSALGSVLHKIVARPAATLDRLSGNLRSLRQGSGPLFFALFVITTLTPLLIRPLRDPYPRRLMLCAWVWFYLLGVSLITDLIPRYLHVVIPLLILHVVREVDTLASMAAISAVRWRRAALCVTLLIGGVAVFPVHPASIDLRGGYSVDPASLATLRVQVGEGQAVMAPAPLDAYLLGAGYRVLPNDTLEKVSRYAERTGVRWLVVGRLPHDLNQIKQYSHRWYLERGLGSAHDPYLEKCCAAESGEMTLYRFRERGVRGAALPPRFDSDPLLGQDRAARRSHGRGSAAEQER